MCLCVTCKSRRVQCTKTHIHTHSHTHTHTHTHVHVMNIRCVCEENVLKCKCVYARPVSRAVLYTRIHTLTHIHTRTQTTDSVSSLPPSLPLPPSSSLPSSRSSSLRALPLSFSHTQFSLPSQFPAASCFPLPSSLSFADFQSIQHVHERMRVCAHCTFVHCIDI